MRFPRRPRPQAADTTAADAATAVDDNAPADDAVPADHNAAADDNAPAAGATPAADTTAGVGATPAAGAAGARGPRHARPRWSGPRGRRRWSVLAVAAVCASLLTTLAVRAGADRPDTGPECRGPATGLLEPRCGAWFGAFVPHEKSNLREKVEAYERRIGRRLDIVYTYHDMSEVTSGRLEGQLLTEQERLLGEDRMLLLSWESKVWGGTKAEQPRWADIAAGTYDAEVIDVQARRIKEYGEGGDGRKVFLSFDLEMDTRVPENGTAGEFVAAWRHIHDRFRQLGVDNVVWTWITTGYPGHHDLIEKLYPGDDYVDWIGYNQYNYFTCHDTRWMSFAETQRSVHRWIRTHLSDEKPLMLSEFGSAYDTQRPSRQADWYREVPDVLRELDGVKAALQWNSRDPGPHCDLSLADQDAWDAMRRLASDPYLHQPAR
ncbi:glycoside hydrolase family 26 protein [Streptomyces sp. NPDC056600]|uniref:glycoside hydrolase family 26 protein n=1 Tax=Streptomyces sp. NPDC056600 TaxID=3345874 RepID=UPI00368529C1